MSHSPQNVSLLEYGQYGRGLLVNVTTNKNVIGKQTTQFRFR